MAQTDPAPEVQGMTFEDLLAMLEHLYTRAATDGRSTDNSYLEFALAYGVIASYLGLEWAKRFISPFETDLTSSERDGRTYLGSGLEGKKNRAWLEFHVIGLGNQLLALHAVPGFWERISGIAEQGQDVESTLGELSAAALLNVPSLCLRFVVPTGKKGSDFDAEVTTTKGRRLCCEIKAKSHTTDLSLKTICNTLDHARRQFPKKEPGLVLLRLPNSWLVAGVEDIVNAAIEKVFRQSNRLVAVIVQFQQMYYQGTKRLATFDYRTYRNTRSEFFSNDIDDVLNVIQNIPIQSYAALLDAALEQFRFKQLQDIISDSGFALYFNELLLSHWADVRRRTRQHHLNMRRVPQQAVWVRGTPTPPWA